MCPIDASDTGSDTSHGDASSFPLNTFSDFSPVCSTVNPLPAATRWMGCPRFITWRTYLCASRACPSSWQPFWTPRPSVICVCMSSTRNFDSDASALRKSSVPSGERRSSSRFERMASVVPRASEMPIWLSSALRASSESLPESSEMAPRKRWMRAYVSWMTSGCRVSENGGTLQSDAATSG